MYIVLLIVAILVCVLLAIIVLIQNPKGGGLSSNFSSSSQMLGVQKTGDILEKGTWVLAISLMVLSLGINMAVKSSSGGSDASQYRDQIQKASKPTGAVNSTMPPLSAPAAPAKPTDTTKK